MRRSLLLAVALTAGACASDNPPGPTLEGVDPGTDADLAPEGTLQPEGALTPEPGLAPESSVQPDTTALAPGDAPE